MLVAVALALQLLVLQGQAVLAVAVLAAQTLEMVLLEQLT